MDLAAIGEFINTIGFPIACVVALGYILYKEQMNHKEEVDRLVEAIDNNTDALSEVKQMIVDFKDTLNELRLRVSDLERKDEK